MKNTLLRIVAVLALSGCNLSKPTRKENIYLPTSASNIVAAGNGWLTFDFNGHKYLYRATDATTYGAYTSRTEALTVMPDEATPPAPQPR